MVLELELGVEPRSKPPRRFPAESDSVDAHPPCSPGSRLSTEDRRLGLAVIEGHSVSCCRSRDTVAASNHGYYRFIVCPTCPPSSVVDER
jgi:hypothetical protein